MSEENQPEAAQGGWGSILIFALVGCLVLGLGGLAVFARVAMTQERLEGDEGGFREGEKMRKKIEKDPTGIKVPHGKPGRKIPVP